MEHPGFFERAAPIRLDALAQKVGAQLGPGADPGLLIHDVKGLADADAGHVSFLNNRKFLSLLATTRASACLVAPAFASRVPGPTVALVVAQPYRGFALALQLLYPDAMVPKAAMAHAGEPHVHPSARLEEDVRIEPGAVVGYRVTIGRGSYVGPGASVTHALVGDRVILHAGVRVGQDGFGFAMDAKGHIKVPQIGRVIIQDDVEIGANSCIDRGALKDTVIGEGTKIDNLVQIGHNVVMGRHCVIVGQTGIAGSAELGDFVVLGGQSGLVGHIKVGSGAQIAGGSHAKDDIAAGARMGGTPAVPFMEWARQMAAIKRLTQKEGRSGSE